MNKSAVGLTFIVCAGLLALLAYKEYAPKPNLSMEFMPDMYDSTNFKAQSEDKHSVDGAAAKIPPAGTVPRGFEPYHFGPADTLKAGDMVKNPLTPTPEVMARGKKIFNTYCIVCHGPKGSGQGFIVPPYPPPPSLLSDKIKKYKDGSIFNVITNGQNIMPSYRVQIKAIDRWAVIYYVRGLQRGEVPTDEEIKELKGQAP
jgi:mono/diheme cytochrome c family protein